MGVINNFKGLFGKKTDSPPPSTPYEAGSAETQSKKILIVEDEALLANAMEKKFKLAGFETYKAKNGQEGLDMATEHIPDIVLLDLMMPVMDGKTMLHRLRELPEFKNTPVIVLTNAGNVDNMRETKTYYNAEAFLVKASTTPDEIVQAAKELL